MDMPQSADPSAVDYLLQEGIAAAKAGQHERARDLLMRVVAQDEENIAGWLWLSGVMDNLDDREVCLENVLTLDPDNATARRGLALLNQQQAKRLLQEGIAAAKASQRERARDLLTRAVEQDETNVIGWLWLSGVVDSLEERKICLENVLTLDPDNQAARRGLDLLHVQEDDSAPPSAQDAISPGLTRKSLMMEQAEAPPTPASAILREDFIKYQETPEIELAPLPDPTQDEFADEYLCPYCAHPTQPQDRKCEACGNDLWVRFRRLEKPTSLFWMFVPMQFFSAFLLGVIPMIALVYIGLSETGALAQLQTTDTVTLLKVYLDFPTLAQIADTAFEAVPPIFFPLSLLPSLFSYMVFAGLYLRWKRIYYLLLADEFISLIIAVVSVLWLKATSLGMIVGATALSRLLLTLRMEDDLRWDERRLVLHIDQDLSNATDFMIRADLYTKQKMWAMSVLHLRRAVALAPHDPEAHITLAIAYLRLRRYDRAVQSLEQARHISPEHPQVEKLQALIEEMRSAETPPA